MPRSHVLAAVLAAAAGAAAPAGAQTSQFTPAAGPRALSAAGALPRSAERERRAEERREAAAQQPRAAAARPVRFSIAGGLAMPSGDFGDAANMGFGVQGSADFRPAAIPFALRADVSFNRFAFDEDEVGEGSYNVIGGQLNAVLRFGGSGGATASPFRPYVLGGVGVYRSAYSFDDGDDDDEIVPGFGFGGGIDFRFGSSEAFAEVRYQSIRADDTGVDGDPNNFIPIILGIRF